MQVPCRKCVLDAAWATGLPESAPVCCGTPSESHFVGGKGDLGREGYFGTCCQFSSYQSCHIVSIQACSSPPEQVVSWQSTCPASIRALHPKPWSLHRQSHRLHRYDRTPATDHPTLARDNGGLAERSPSCPGTMSSMRTLPPICSEKPCTSESGERYLLALSSVSIISRRYISV